MTKETLNKATELKARIDKLEGFLKSIDGHKMSVQGSGYAVLMADDTVKGMVRAYYQAELEKKKKEFAKL